MARPITKDTTVRLRRIVAKAIVDPRGRYDDEAYRTLLFDGFGVRSTLHLSDEQGRQLIADLSSRRAPASAPTAPRRRAPRYVARGGGFATETQRAYMAGLEDRLGWSESPERLRGFCRRQLRLPANVELIDVAALTPQQCRTVLTGLERLRDEGHGADRRPSSTGPVAGATTA